MRPIPNFDPGLARPIWQQDASGTGIAQLPRFELVSNIPRVATTAAAMASAVRTNLLSLSVSPHLFWRRFYFACLFDDFDQFTFIGRLRFTLESKLVSEIEIAHECEPSEGHLSTTLEPHHLPCRLTRMVSTATDNPDAIEAPMAGNAIHYFRRSWIPSGDVWWYRITMFPTNITIACDKIDLSVDKWTGATNNPGTNPGEVMLALACYSQNFPL